MDTIKLQADSRQAAASADVEVKDIGDDRYYRVVFNSSQLLCIWAALEANARRLDGKGMDGKMYRDLAERIWGWMEQAKRG